METGGFYGARCGVRQGEITPFPSGASGPWMVPAGDLLGSREETHYSPRRDTEALGSILRGLVMFAPVAPFQCNRTGRLFFPGSCSRGIADHHRLVVKACRFYAADVKQHCQGCRVLLVNIRQHQSRHFAVLSQFASLGIWASHVTSASLDARNGEKEVGQASTSVRTYRCPRHGCRAMLFQIPASPTSLYQFVRPRWERPWGSKCGIPPSL